MEKQPAPKKAAKKLSAKWLFDAAMLSSPMDLGSLVSLSLESPATISNEAGLLKRMVAVVLNGPGKRHKVGRQTRLDVLHILANCALTVDDGEKNAVRDALSDVSAWFDEYMAEEGVEMDAVVALGELGAPLSPEPEIHKAMLVLLCRVFDYELRTEDLLELCRGNRRLALETVCGLLEDGEAVSTAACCLLRGFTHPATYFKAMDEGFYFLECGVELPEYCIEQFSLEMHGLLAVAMRDQLVEKLSYALHDALFHGEARVLSNTEHAAVFAAHNFFQNLYLYGGGVDAPLEGPSLAEIYRGHLICDTLLVPHLVLPYLERCIYHAQVLHRRHLASRDALAILGPECEGLVDDVTARDMDDPALTHGIAATLRTLVIATFRAPRTRVMFQILRRFNPTPALLEMKGFLNVNMGSFDVSRGAMKESLADVYKGFTLLQDVADVYASLDGDKKRRILRRLEQSGALPLARDTPSYTALLNLLWGGGGGQFEYLRTAHRAAVSLMEAELDGALASSDDDDDGCGLDHDDDLGETAAFRGARRPRPPRRSASDAAAAEGGVFFHTSGRGDDSELLTTRKLGGDARGEPPTPKISKLAPPPKADAPAPASYDDAPKVLSLLGDLPTLDAHRKDRKPKKKELKAFLDLDLEVPVAQLHVNNADHRAEQRALGYVQGDRGPLSPTSMKPVADGAVPRRLCCAINGHLMRDPVRARGKPHAPAFERETIELWLETRGSVCPITGAPLEKIDLAADAALRNEIVRYHIARTTLADEQDPFELIKASKTTNDKGEPQTPTPKARDDDAEADLYDF
ncbi:hypothetical protein JL721_10717 [Aureococcus anophagefferens]|nr:hypothetical protein JL721_10717 [Aureococcus anophagefferens]